MTELTPEQVEKITSLAQDFAREGRTDELVEFLDHGFPLEATGADSNTLLMLAAYNGQVATTRTLLERGADPDALNERNQSIIAGALFKGEAEIVALLRDAGADLDLGTPTARAAAEMFGRTDLLQG